MLMRSLYVDLKNCSNICFEPLIMFRVPFIAPVLASVSKTLKKKGGPIDLRNHGKLLLNTEYDATDIPFSFERGGLCWGETVLPDHLTNTYCCSVEARLSGCLRSCQSGQKIPYKTRYSSQNTELSSLWTISMRQVMRCIAISVNNSVNWKCVDTSRDHLWSLHTLSKG